MALQKLAHRDSEKRQKRNLVKVNSRQSESTDSQSGDNDNYNSMERGESSSELVEQDSDQSLKTYCSWKFLLGLITMFCSIGVHTYLLQYISLTLLAANTATSIIATLILSTVIFGEVFIVKYDLTALILIVSGCIILVLNSNTT